MKILITNDDGTSLGLAVLRSAVQEAFPDDEIFVFIPKEGVSGLGRSMTFGSGKKVKVKKNSGNFFEVHGTPADCVEIGCRIHKIDLVLSGINHGWNLSQDFYVSGTVQAACHAWEYFQIPSIAFSGHPDSLNAPFVRNKIKGIMGLFKENNPIGVVSVNFPLKESPEVPKIRVTQHGKYLARGPLTPDISGKDGYLVFDLLEPMNQMEKSSDDINTDVGCVEAGFTSVTLHYNSNFKLWDI